MTLPLLMMSFGVISNVALIANMLIFHAVCAASDVADVGRAGLCR